MRPKSLGLLWTEWDAWTGKDELLAAWTQGLPPKERTRFIKQFSNWKQKLGYIPWRHFGPTLWALVTRATERSVHSSTCPLHPEIEGADMQKAWKHLSYIYRLRAKHAELWRKVAADIETIHNFIEVLESASAQKPVTKRRAR